MNAIARIRDAVARAAAADAAKTAAAMAATLALAVAGCVTAPPPPPPTVAPPVLAPVIIVQPVKPEIAAPVIVPAPPEPPKINEEAEEALTILSDLQKLILASGDEQKRELNLATQAVARQKSDSARLRLGMLQSLPANGSDENRAIATLEPLLKANGPVRAAAIVILAQLSERQRSIREEKKRAEDLQQKLDALKKLERSLLGRERKQAP